MLGQLPLPGTTAEEPRDQRQKWQEIQRVEFSVLGYAIPPSSHCQHERRQVSSKLCFQMFNDKWRSTWDCQKVISDRGLHNRGGFAQGLVARGVQFGTIEVESPEELWRTEGHGAILKGIIQRFWRLVYEEFTEQGERLHPDAVSIWKTPTGNYKYDK